MSISHIAVSGYGTGVPKMIAFIDDLLILGVTINEQVINLRVILKRLPDVELHLKNRKWEFLNSLIPYLGYD